MSAAGQLAALLVEEEAALRRGDAEAVLQSCAKPWKAKRKGRRGR